MRADVALLDDVARRRRAAKPAAAAPRHERGRRARRCARWRARAGSGASGAHRRRRADRRAHRRPLRAARRLARSAPSAAASSPIRSRRARARGARARCDRSRDASLDQFLREAGNAGVALAELPVRLGVGRADAGRAARRAASGWRVGRRGCRARARGELDRASRSSTRLTRITPRIRSASGAPRQWLRTRVRAPRRPSMRVVDGLVREGRIVVEQGDVRLADVRAAAHRPAAHAGRGAGGAHCRRRRRSRRRSRSSPRRWAQSPPELACDLLGCSLARARSSRSSLTGYYSPDSVTQLVDAAARGNGGRTRTTGPPSCGSSSGSREVSDPLPRVLRP